MLRRIVNAFILVLVVSLSTSAVGINADEYAVKAAFIYNFSKYVEWENKSLSSNEVFKLRVYQKSEIESHLKDVLKDKKIQGKKVDIGNIKDCSTIEGIQILFIPEQVNLDEFKLIVSKFQRKNTLIISEKKGRLEYGAGINFLEISNKIKFEINLNALKTNNLKASSQLLKLAERIEE